jgi:hypothetical protein
VAARILWLEALLVYAKPFLQNFLLFGLSVYWKRKEGSGGKLTISFLLSWETSI